MKRTIKIRERPAHVDKKIEVELPYYWEHDVTPDDSCRQSIWHGRLNSDLSEDQIMYGGRTEFEIRRSRPAAGGASMDGCYLRPEYASTVGAFEKAFQALQDAVAAIGERGRGLD